MHSTWDANKIVAGQLKEIMLFFFTVRTGSGEFTHLALLAAS